MKLSILVGWVARALVIVLSLVNSRLLIELTGVDGFAIQSILVSLTMWFVILNIGIPSATQNLISRYRAAGKDYERLKQTASSAVLIVFVVLLPLVMLLGVAVKHLVLKSYPDVATSAVILFCVGLFVAGLSLLFNQILYAEQRGHWPNVYPALNALFVTCSLVLFNFFSISNINFVLMVFVLSNLVIAILGILQAKIFRVWCFDRHILADIWRDSRGFALFSSLSAAVLGIDYLIMSRILPAQDIALYNICQRVFMALLSVHAIMLTSSWSGVSEVLFSRQWVSARKRVRNLLMVGGAMVVVLGGIVMMFMANIADIISHGKITTIPMTLTFLFLVYMLLRVWSDTYAMALLSVNETKVVNRYIPFQAAISIGAQIALGSRYGTRGIMLGLIISFLATAVWILPSKFYKLTRE